MDEKKIVVDRVEFLKILDRMKHGLANKEIVEQSTSFIFSDGRVFAFNDTVLVSSDTHIEGTFSVSASELMAVFNKLKEKEVSLTVGENELLLKSGKFKAGVRLDKEIKLSVEEVKMPKRWRSLPEGFIDGLKTCEFSASRDMSRPTFCTIHITENKMDSFDNYRFTRYTMKGRFVKRALLPIGSASVLSGLEGLKEYGVAKGWLHFKMEDGVEISCRTYDGDYPDIDGLIEGMGEGQSVIFPDKLKEALERVSVLSEDDLADGKTVTVLWASDGELILRGEGSAGWAEEKFDAPTKGKDDIKFKINPKFLLDILSHNSKIQITDDGSKMVFEGDNFIHVLCLSAV